MVLTDLPRATSLNPRTYPVGRRETGVTVSQSSNRQKRGKDNLLRGGQSRKLLDPSDPASGDVGVETEDVAFAGIGLRYLDGLIHGVCHPSLLVWRR